MKLLADSSKLEAIKDNPWLYDGVFLMEYVDYRNNKKLYRKTRVILVDGIPYPCHSIFLTAGQFMQRAGQISWPRTLNSVVRRNIFSPTYGIRA